MTIQPLYDKIVVEPQKQEEKTPSGIYIPETAKERPNIGTVISVGNGRISDSGNLIPMFIESGDKVMYNKFTGTEINLEGQTYLIMRENEVLAILNNSISA